MPKRKSVGSALWQKLKRIGSREYVYPNQRGRRPKPSGRDQKYLGSSLRQTPDGTWATDLDWDSRFDTQADAKRFIKTYMKRRGNPKKRGAADTPKLPAHFVTARVRKLSGGRIEVQLPRSAARKRKSR